MAYKESKTDNFAGRHDFCSVPSCLLLTHNFCIMAQEIVEVLAKSFKDPRYFVIAQRMLGEDGFEIEKITCKDSLHGYSVTWETGYVENCVYDIPDGVDEDKASTWFAEEMQPWLEGHGFAPYMGYLERDGNRLYESDGVKLSIEIDGELDEPALIRIERDGHEEETLYLSKEDLFHLKTVVNTAYEVARKEAEEYAEEYAKQA